MQITVLGECGVDTAKQLMDFVNVIRSLATPELHHQGLNPVSVNLPSDSMEHNTEIPANENVEEVIEAAVKEEAPATRSSRRTTKKVQEVLPAPVVEAVQAKEPEILPPAVCTAPEGFNDAVKPVGEATPEMQTLALEKVKLFKPKDGEAVNINYCRSLLLYMATRKGMDANLKMLASFNVKKLPDLPEEKLGEFAQKMEAELSL